MTSMSVLTFNKGDTVISGGKKYEYINFTNGFHFVKNLETGVSVYKSEVAHQLNSETETENIEYIDIDEIKDIDVFEESAIKQEEINVIFNKSFNELINNVNNVSWEDGIKLIPNESVDLVLTDPPYGIGYFTQRRKVSKNHTKIKGDDNLDWLPNLVNELYRVLKDGSHCYIFCSHHFIEVFKTEFSKLFSYKHILIWDKKVGNLGDLKGNYSTYTEFCLFLTKGKGKDLNGKRDGNIISTGRTRNELHPTQKPINLNRYLISKSTQKGELVLDCFAGSHSCLKAAIKSGRRCISFEIEDKYCKDAERDIIGLREELF